MKILCGFILLTLSSLVFALTQPLTAGKNWYFYANAIDSCTPGSVTLPNLGEMTFLQTAIGMAVDTSEQQKINRYFKNSNTIVTISGKENGGCVMKVAVHPADGSLVEFECKFSKESFPVISRIADELAKDHTGMTAAPFVIDGIKAALDSCKQSF